MSTEKPKRSYERKKSAPTEVLVPGTDVVSMVDGGKVIKAAPWIAKMFPDYIATMNVPITDRTVYEFEWKVGSGGAYLVYITARCAYSLLNKAFGMSWIMPEFRIQETAKGIAFIATIQLLHPETGELLPFRRMGVADATSISSVKGGESDAYKRSIVSLFPNIELLYNAPKVTWDKSKGSQPDALDVIDILDMVTILHSQGRIRDKRKVTIGKDATGYYAYYYDYIIGRWQTSYGIELPDDNMVAKNDDVAAVTVDNNIDQTIDAKQEEVKKDTQTQLDKARVALSNTRYRLTWDNGARSAVGSVVEYDYRQHKQDFLDYIKSNKGVHRNLVRVIGKSSTYLMCAGDNDRLYRFPLDSKDVVFLMKETGKGGFGFTVAEYDGVLTKEIDNANA